MEDFEVRLIERRILRRIRQNRGGRTVIHDNDIPDSDADIVKALVEDPASFLDWIRKAINFMTASKETVAHTSTGTEDDETARHIQIMAAGCVEE